MVRDGDRTRDGNRVSRGAGDLGLGDAGRTPATSTAPADAEPIDCGVVCGERTAGYHPGTCDCACADPAWSACPIATADGEAYDCVDLLHDGTNCGACGLVCSELPNAAGGACFDGTCQIYCDAGYSTCGDVPQCSTYLPTDPANCGACGNACPFNFLCNQGACVCGYLLVCAGGSGGPTGNADCTGCDCSAGLTYCYPNCVDLRSDPNNCGACGAVCDFLTPDCDAGSCQPIAEQ